MNTEILCYFLLIGFTVLGISTNSLSFNPIRFHCDNYVLNTYLYFILSWGIVMATNSTLSNSNVKLNELFSGPFTILIFLGSLVLLMSLLFVPPKMFFTKHHGYPFVGTKNPMNPNNENCQLECPQSHIMCFGFAGGYSNSGGNKSPCRTYTYTCQLC